MLKKILFSLFIFIGCIQATENLVDKGTISFPNEVYTIEKPLGEGAFSKVFLVRDSKGEKFALKAYKRNPFSYSYEDDFSDYEDVSDYEGFYSYGLYNDIEREFQRGQDLSHPNIVKTHNFLIDDSLSKDYFGYLILEMVPGETVSRFPPKGLGQDQTYLTVKQLIDAIRYSASLDYMHIDFACRNVVINAEERPKIIDVGSFVSMDEMIDLLEVWDNNFYGYSYFVGANFSCQKRRQRVRCANIALSSPRESFQFPPPFDSFTPIQVFFQKTL